MFGRCRLPLRGAVVAGSLLMAALIASGCVAAGSTGSTESASPRASDNPSASTSGLYLRAWQSQALAPQYTFGWLPSVTIANGQLIDGMVAVPAIYPGPIYVGLSSRTISQTDVDAIVALARQDGILDSNNDFSQGMMPGGIASNVLIVVDGTSYQVEAPVANAKSANAARFTDFLGKIQSLGTWLTDLGPEKSYTPDRLAVLVGAPKAPDQVLTSTPKPATWPLTAGLDTFGTALAGYRCGVVTGADLTALLPIVQAANQLTIFTDSAGHQASLQTRVLVPEEPGPCP